MRWLWFIIAMFAAAPASGAHSRAQQTPPTFHANVTDVRVDVEVREGKRLVMGLVRSDFVVWDEGEVQELVYCGQEAVGLDLVLVLDVSGSVHRLLGKIAVIGHEALDELHENDRVAVMAFSRFSALVQPLTNDHAQVEAGLKLAGRGMALGSGTRINGAVIDAARYLTSARSENGALKDPRRQAVLIITDNNGLSFFGSSKRAVQFLFEADATLNAIVVGNHPHPQKLKDMQGVDFELDDVFVLADETGGEAETASNNPQERLRGMIADIRNRYSLAYRAPAARPGTLRRIRVDLSAEAREKYPTAKLRARSGY
ncbi:MAG: VWA domain-containing protein, partial [Bryobacteraceae bacterium]